MNEKIRPEHRERTAYVYVRQSSMEQVRNHLESQRRQYGMADRARGLGFERIVVIDDDLGRSGSGSEVRPGFAKLLAAVCQGAAGAVLALEASRLARNNRDWYHLLDLCARTDTLVIDEDGIYDPRQVNDRLLLGMKGTLSEFELSLLRQRSQEARMQMIRRGEVLWEVPVGFVRTEDYKIELTSDRQVQEAIRGVFRKFREVGSARQVLLWYRQEELPLPQVKPGTAGREIVWRPPVYGSILKILRNPCYAGAFVYGRSSTKTVVEDGRARKACQRHVPVDEWQVLISDHHPGYISWQEYQRNQEVLESNANMRRVSKCGAAKTGPALLAGLLRCARCGRMLHVTYSGAGGRVPRYQCRGGQINHGTAWCISTGGLRLDRAVSAKVLDALQPAGVLASLEALERARGSEDEKRRALELALEKARYEAERARRQYDAVEPENRLVAGELESRWNEALQRVAELESRLEATVGAQEDLSDDDRERLLRLGEDLQAAWNDPEAPPPLKKRILRTVLEEIIIDVQDQPPRILLTLHWAGGVHTRLCVRKNRRGHHGRSTELEVVDLVRELAKICRDRDIASILNRLGYRTGPGNNWKASRVQSLRHYHKIPPFDESRRREWLTLAEAAAALGVSPAVVRRLIKETVLPARQVVANAPWIIARQAIELPAVLAAVAAVRRGGRVPRNQPGQLELQLE